MVADTHNHPVIIFHVTNGKESQQDLGRNHVKYLYEDSLKYHPSGDCDQMTLGTKWNKCCLLKIYYLVIFLKKINSTIKVKLHPVYISKIGCIYVDYGMD